MDDKLVNFENYNELTKYKYVDTNAPLSKHVFNLTCFSTVEWYTTEMCVHSFYWELNELVKFFFHLTHLYTVMDNIF